MSDWFEGYSCRCSDGSQCQAGLRDILVVVQMLLRWSSGLRDILVVVQMVLSVRLV